MAAWTQAPRRLSAEARVVGEGWPTYGGDAGGERYSAERQINRANIGELGPVWTFHTGALKRIGSGVTEAAFEATPVLLGETLYLTTPFDEVIALDAATGELRWRYDPKLPADEDAGVFTSRGVAVWSETAGQKAVAMCGDRVFVGTLDARLIALDARSGAMCEDFGEKGSIDLRAGVPTQGTKPYQNFGTTSPGTVVGDVIVMGSAVADGQQVDVEPGVVRGFDVRTGRKLWSWDPLPWAASQKVRTGAGNTWSVIAADVERGLVYLPTGSPSPDFYGGMRPGNDADADSVVALDARTGRKVWSFQVVHHDLWDYDIAAEPLLFTFRGEVAAVAVLTKMGTVFVLNRVTGEPLYPVEERAVPKSDVGGEAASATQPFSSLPSLSPLTMDTGRIAGNTPADAAACAKKIRQYRYEGMFTPPSVGGSILFPGSLGGVNWGSAAYDPVRGVLYANTNRQIFATTLIPRWRWEVEDLVRSWENWLYAAGSLLLVACLLRRRWNPGSWVGTVVAVLLLGAGGAAIPRREDKARQHFGNERAPQRGAPYAVERRPLYDSKGLPCTLPPWGALTALNLDTGVKSWEQTLGTMVEGKQTGSLNLGGPIVTGGGLVFAAGTREPLLRAFDAGTGEEVWKGALPAPAQATPMSYAVRGRQYVVIAAGGHGGFETPTGDTMVAFALPEAAAK